MMWTWQWNSFNGWEHSSPGYSGVVVSYPTAAEAMRDFDEAYRRKHLANNYRLLFGRRVIAELKRDRPQQRFRVVWK